MRFMNAFKIVRAEHDVVFLQRLRSQDGLGIFEQEIGVVAARLTADDVRNL